MKEKIKKKQFEILKSKTSKETFLTKWLKTYKTRGNTFSEYKYYSYGTENIFRKVSYKSSQNTIFQNNHEIKPTLNHKKNHSWMWKVMLMFYAFLSTDWVRMSWRKWGSLDSHWSVHFVENQGIEEAWWYTWGLSWTVKNWHILSNYQFERVVNWLQFSLRRSI